MSKITNEIELLFKTKLSKESQQEVGKNLKSLLENAAIGFDEAETKKNLQPIIRMMKTMFDKAEMAFDADKLLGMPSRQALQSMADLSVEQLQIAFDKALAKSGGIKIDFGNVDLSSMTEPLEKLTQELSEVGERVASTTKKSVDEIEKSLRSLSKNKKFKTVASVPSIEDTLVKASDNKSLSASKAVGQLEKARNLYSNSVKEDNPWVVQYKYLLEFVSKYERLTENAKLKIEKDHSELKQLYDVLSPKAGDVKISLEHFVDVAKGRELSEYKNQPWARESTLKEVAQTLKSGITVHDGPTSSSGSYNNTTVSPQPDEKQGIKNKISAEQEALELVRKRRAEAEAMAEAERKIAEEVKKAATKKVFRVIYEPEEPDDRSREEVLESYGAEYWTDSKSVAETYADMGDNPVILEGEVISNKPFIIDAGGHKWNSFELMRAVEENPEDPSNPIITDLREKFPDLFKRIDAGEFGRDYGAIQAELNKEIKALRAGYDAIITRNVIDAADADSFREASTTYAVLDDGILHVEAAIIGAADEDGLYDFDGDSKKENIPEYYKMPVAPSEYTDISASIPKIEYNADELQKMIEGLAVLEQKLQHLGEGASIDQSNLSDELARYQRLIQEIASSTIVESEDDRQKLIELREEALRLATALQSFQLNDNDIAGQASAYGITKDASKALMDAEETAKKLRNELEAIFRFQFDEIYDALPDDEQKKLQDYGSEWNEVSRNIVTGLQAEITTHRNNADAIEDEASAQDKLNVKKKEEQPTNGTHAATNIQPVVVEPAKDIATHDSIQTEELQNLLSAITYNIKVVQDTEPTEENKVSIDESALENVLNRITYNVKIAHDDTDKQANKIAIDEGILESTLKRVFTNVLNPHTEQNDSKPKNEPWARERTLQNVKEVLGQIQANTTKIEPQQSINNVENILSAIKIVAESVDKKIVRGTKTVIGGEDIDTKKKPKTADKRDAQVLAERIETQKLALSKFKTELITSGKMTDEVAKQVRGLAISLGMVKDSKGLTRWGEKFKQQKLGVGITDVATKGSIAEQNVNIKEWISLSKQLGELDAKINSGLFDDAIIAQAKQERELVLRRIDEVMGLINSPDAGFTRAGKANFDGHYDTVEAEKSKQIGKLISQYEQLGQLQARAETSGAFVDREKYEQLSREVQSETEILHLHEAQNAELLEALQARQENAYISEKDVEYAKEQKRLFTEYVSLVKQIGKLDGIINTDTTDTISKINAQAEKDALMRLADDIRPQLDLTREDLIAAGDASMAGEEASSIIQRQKALVDLAKQHKELGKLQAQEAHTQVAELQKKIDAQRVVLQLTQEEQDVLAQITEDARQDVLNKQADKDIKKQAANAKKMAQREAMLGKAGNAVGRAENTWMSAAGIEGELPADFNVKIDEYYQKLDALRQKHQELKNSDMISEEQKQELIEQTMSINKMTEEIGELVSEYQRLSGDNVTVIGANTLGVDAGLDAYEQQLKQAVMTATNGKAQIKNFDAATKTLTYTVKTGKNEFTEYTAAVRRVDGALVEVQGTTKRTETFFEATARKMKELTSYFSGMAIFNRIGQELRRGIQYVREIDLALTELKKVTDETEETYDKFLDTAAKTGARLGTTISAVTEATATFAKLGYSMEQATEMAEAAIVYKNVGDNIESTGDAADSIISTMKGFKLEATESMAIVDRFNEVGNRFAITSQGIGEALRLSASALSEGGNSLDESIALITAANEVVNDPSSVGTALKTLTLRLRGSKTELEEMGEDVTDMATTTSQLQAKLLALTGGQVDIMLDENTFKNSTQILREMAEAWEDMNDIQRASALELMGGKRQAMFCPSVQKCA